MKIISKILICIPTYNRTKSLIDCIKSIKKLKIKSIYGEKINFNPKTKSFSRYMIGGIIFGLGWALAGACPGPMFTLVGAGYIPIFIVIIASLLGTFLYGLLKGSLPH